MVARDGNAPPSAGCGPAALLLSYRAMKKWHPHPVMLRGLPIESRTCCYCTMRAETWRSTKDLHLGRLIQALLFSRQVPRLAGRAPLKDERECPSTNSRGHSTRFIKRVAIPTTEAAGHEQAKRVEWLPGVDSHHDIPLNRRACSFDITGEEKVLLAGVAPTSGRLEGGGLGC